MIVRRLACGLAILSLAAAVLRSAVVADLDPSQPSRAAAWWPGHPASIEAAAQRDVAAIAGRGGAPTPALIDRFKQVAARAPMAVSPLLVHAIAAQQAGDVTRAERLFILAAQRQPRELSPHYFLADQYLRDGRVAEGLREFVFLVRLAPGTIAGAAPYVAQYARQPANWPGMAAAFRQEPRLASAVLAALARDPSNVNALFALARDDQRRPDAPWVAVSLQAHIAAGRHAEARALWARIAGLDGVSNTLVHAPDFSDSVAPGPFNWTIAQSGVGTAERQKGGGLHVLFYGSQSGSLLRQLLVLPPGRYRLVTKSDGKLAEPESLNWVLSCDPSGTQIGQFPVRPGALAVHEFVVPGTCPAQWLSLDAQAQDIRGDSDIRVAFARLERAGS